MSGRRAQLWEVLRRHDPADAKEATDLMRMAGFAASAADPCDRDASAVHFTASALVVSPAIDRVLLIHHRRLDRWLQPGGHIDADDASPQAAAMREALEETGVPAVRPHPLAPGLLDIDVHVVPPKDGEPAHEHLDLRHLLVADPAEPLQRDLAETKDAQWFEWAEALSMMAPDRALGRLFDKALVLRPNLVA